MSIKVMSSIWDHSRQSGTALLMLLAIADNANEYGEAWPSIDTLAAKCRMKRRNAQLLLAELQESGELLIGIQAGQPTRHGATNLFTIVTPGALVRPGVQSSAPHEGNGVQSSAWDAKLGSDGVQSSARWGAISCADGVQSSTHYTSVKPSLNHHHQPAAPAGANRGERGGGGDEFMEIDDVGEHDEGNDAEDSQLAEADTVHLKADLVDALVALGVRPALAIKAVTDRTVTNDRDVILCKRFLLSSTAHVPAAVLWSQYLSLGKLPPAPYSDQSSVTDDLKEAARKMYEANEARAREAEQYTVNRDMAAVLSQRTLKSIDQPAKKRVFQWAQP